MNIRLVLMTFLLTTLWTSACARVSVPLIVNPTATPIPTQVPLPTRVAIVAPTPTLQLIPPGDNSEATTMLQDFFVALGKGDLETALSYWNTSQSKEYAANVRKMVQEWITLKRKLTLREITYLGRDATGKFVSMPLTDPRVEQAIAKVYVDGIEYQFYLSHLKGGWFIEGVNTFVKSN
ncbi:MAG: hypothetical protein N2559_02400 [Anaerolineae bacterium]|nr:hypothetical protein [Anaerolineae bacterium]